MKNQLSRLLFSDGNATGVRNSHILLSGGPSILKRSDSKHRSVVEDVLDAFEGGQFGSASAVLLEPVDAETEFEIGKSRNIGRVIHKKLSVHNGVSDEDRISILYQLIFRSWKFFTRGSTGISQNIVFWDGGSEETFRLMAELLGDLYDQKEPKISLTLAVGFDEPRFNALAQSKGLPATQLLMALEGVAENFQANSLQIRVMTPEKIFLLSDFYRESMYWKRVKALLPESVTFEDVRAWAQWLEFKAARNRSETLLAREEMLTEGFFLERDSRDSAGQSLLSSSDEREEAERSMGALSKDHPNWITEGVKLASGVSEIGMTLLASPLIFGKSSTLTEVIHQNPTLKKLRPQLCARLFGRFVE